MSRYFIRLSYVGTTFNGWQKQPLGQGKSVQGLIENALTLLLKDNIEIVGCGRTDTGVHALNYIAHFDVNKPFDREKMIFTLNKMLPYEIGIHDIIPVHDDAHARFDAVSRQYNYKIHTQKDPFLAYSWYYTYGDLSLDVLNEAAHLLLEYSDFNTFCKSHSDVKTTTCQVTRSQWTKMGSSFEYTVEADRFLRGMIRLVVGMCVQVCRGKLTLEKVKSALENREKTGRDWSVPAIGLTLSEITYPYLDDLHK